MGPLTLLLGGACPLLRAGAQYQFLRRYRVLVGLGRNVIQTGAQTEEGGRRHMILGYCMNGAFFGCSEVVAVAKKYEKKKGNKKNRKGDRGNE